MAGGERPPAGGILGLHADVLSDPALRDALRFDLVALGRSLDDAGTEALSWTDLLAVVRRLPARHGSELARELNGFDPPTLEAQYLAAAADLLAAANWQRVGRRGAPRPKPVDRPWTHKRDQRVGSAPIPVRDFDAWWDAAGPD